MGKNKKPLFYAGIAFILSLTFTLYLAQILNDHYIDGELAQISQQSKVSAAALDLILDDYRNSLKSLARYPELLDPELSESAKVSILRSFSQGSRVIRFGIADSTGESINSDALAFSVKDEPWFNETMESGKASFAELSVPFGLGERVFVLSEPLLSEDRIVGVAFLIQSMASMMSQVEFSLGHQYDFVYLLNEDLEFLDDNEDAFKDAFKSYYAPNLVYSRIAANKTSSFEIKTETESYFASIAQVSDDSGLLVLTSSPRSLIIDDNRAINEKLFIISILTSTLFAALCYLLVYFYLRLKKIERHEQLFLDSKFGVDALTGLRGKDGLIDLIQSSIKDLAPNEMQFIAIVSVGTFDELEKSSGTELADIVRAILANRLKGLETDSLQVGLHGRDSYLFYGRGFATRRDTQNFALSLKSLIDEPVRYSDLHIDIVSSLGLRLFYIGEKNAGDINYLIECAEYSLEKAQLGTETSKGAKLLPRLRTESSDNVYIFDNAAHEGILKNRSIWNDVSYAAKRGEFKLLFQPVVDLKTGRVHSLEVLLRWLHPEWGMLLLKDFLDAAIRQGYSVELSKWSTEALQEQLKDLNSFDLSVSMNLAASELLNPFHIEYLSALASGSKAAHKIAFEIPLKAILSENKQIREAVQRLSAGGSDLYIDDFEVCAKNVDYLSELSVSGVKLDGANMSDISFNEDRRRNTRSFIEICDNYGVEVVAKNVSNKNIVQELLWLGCRLGQGQHLLRPLSATELSASLEVRDQRNYEPGLFLKTKVEK